MPLPAPARTSGKVEKEVRVPFEESMLVFTDIPEGPRPLSGRPM